MSSSEGERLFPLTLRAPVRRLRITVFDGRDRVVHRAFGDAVVDLAPGLYRVRYGAELSPSVRLRVG